MVQRTADCDRRAICLTFEGRYDWILEDGEGRCEIRREISVDRCQRLDAKGQEWNICERELGVEGHQGQKPEWTEIWAILMPMGSDWWDIFHKRSWILWGRWEWWISFHVSGPMWGEGEKGGVGGREEERRMEWRWGRGGDEGIVKGEIVSIKREEFRKEWRGSILRWVPRWLRMHDGRDCENFVIVKWLSCLVQNGGSWVKAWEISLAERIWHSSLKFGKEMPPLEIERDDVEKEGCICEVPQMKLLIIFWMDFMKFGGGGQIGE